MSTLSEMRIHLRMDLFSRQLGRLVNPSGQVLSPSTFSDVTCAFSRDFESMRLAEYSESDTCRPEQAVGGRNDGLGAVHCLVEQARPLVPVVPDATGEEWRRKAGIKKSSVEVRWIALRMKPVS
jgi:hypothetical protein